MSSYIEEKLTKGEVVLLSGKIALRKYWLNYLLAFPYLTAELLVLFNDPGKADRGGRNFTFITMLALVAVLLVVPVVRYFTNEFALTNKRVIAKCGLISLDAIEIRLGEIESIIVKQGMFGKQLDYGTIVVVGTGATHAVFPAVLHPVIFKRQMNSALEKTSADKSGAQSRS